MLLPLLVPVWLAAADPSVLAPDEVDAIELPWSLYQELRGPEPTDDSPGPWVAERDVELRPVEGGWELHARYTVRAKQAGWLWHSLAGSGIELRQTTLDGHVAPVVALPGAYHLVAWIERDTVLELRGFLPGSPDERIDLSLLPATLGRLRVSVPDRVPVAVVGPHTGEAPPLLHGGILWSGASSLSVQLRDPTSAPPVRETLAVAHAGVGLTVGDAELRGRAHLQWELRHGTLDRVHVALSGLGEDLTVQGRDVASWSRQGDGIDVELSSPVTGRLDLELSWSQAVPAGDEASVALPSIEPQAWRTESSLQIARDGEIEVIPQAQDWTAVAASELPEWGQGLVEGTPTAAYQRAGGQGSGQLDLLRFVPVPGPPTVVDVASYTLATTDEGRVLMRAHYELRNDRGAHLTVRPPPGLRIIGARVAGETALPSRDEQDAWRIPLKRSLETVEGLLSFPVEVILIGELEPWARRERRELPLPTLDAPIAAAHVTLHLPPRYRSRLEEGEHNVVDSFDQGEGLTYGMGVGEVGSAAADALFQQAVEGYLANDFEAAQAKLDELEQLGVDNQNMLRLQSNIDVIEGKAGAKDKGDVTMQRRVKEQAKARAAEQFREQEELILEAERAASAGDYAEAEAQYQAALQLGGTLAKLEQTESVEQESRNLDVELELKSVAKKKGKKANKASASKVQLDTKYRAPAEDGPAFRSGSDATVATATTPLEPAPSEGSAFGTPIDPDDVELYLPAASPPATRPEPDAITWENGRTDDPSPVAGEDEIAMGPTPTNGTEYDYANDETVLEDEPQDVPMADPEPASERMVVSRSRGRGRGFGGRVQRRAKRAPTSRERSTRFRGLGGAAGGDGGPASSTDAATVYDFEDDNVDGEILRPEGANLASRASARHSALIDTPASMDVSGDFDYDRAPPPDANEPAPAPARDGVANEALPAPQVTASALDVVIPTTGQAVRYQQLLIEANQTQTITIDARRRLRR